MSIIPEKNGSIIWKGVEPTPHPKFHIDTLTL